METARDRGGFALPEAYANPETYLDSSRFHRSLTFTTITTTTIPAGTPTNDRTARRSPLTVTVSYALVGLVPGSSDDDDSLRPPRHHDQPNLDHSRVIVWVNGMGHHRIASAIFDSVARERGVTVLTIDRPSCGRSTTSLVDDLVDDDDDDEGNGNGNELRGEEGRGKRTEERYRERVRIVTESCKKVLRHEKLDDRPFELWTHSNGVIYGLNLLLSLNDDDDNDQDQGDEGPRRRRRRLECERWVLTSPWVLPSISGSLALGFAQRCVPRSWTERLGRIAERVEAVVGSKTVGWSVGVAQECVGWSTGFVRGSTTTTTTTTTQDAGTGAGKATRKRTPRERIESFETLQALKPVEERTFGPRYYPSDMLDQGMKIAVQDGLEGMGVEAVMTLRGKGVIWGWTGRRDEDEVRDEELYEVGFERLKRKVTEDQWNLKVAVWCAGDDGLIPKKGREWLRGLLVDRLRLVEDGDWKEVKKAGHDEILGLEIVVDDLFGRARET